jgi:hypothetical protein
MNIVCPNLIPAITSNGFFYLEVVYSDIQVPLGFNLDTDLFKIHLSYGVLFNNHLFIFHFLFSYCSSSMLVHNDVMTRVAHS